MRPVQQAPAVSPRPPRRPTRASERRSTGVSARASLEWGRAIGELAGRRRTAVAGSLESGGNGAEP
jgi:hypothetical protein